MKKFYEHKIVFIAYVLKCSNFFCNLSLESSYCELLSFNRIFLEIIQVELHRISIRYNDIRFYINFHKYIHIVKDVFESEVELSNLLIL